MSIVLVIGQYVHTNDKVPLEQALFMDLATKTVVFSFSGEFFSFFFLTFVFVIIGNRTSYGPIWSAIILMIKQI